MTLKERLKQAEETATATVQPITDAELRSVAYTAIVRYLMVGHVSYLKEGPNQLTLGFAAILFTLSALSLYFHWSFWASFAFAAATHLAIFGLLGVVGLHSDGWTDLWKRLPHRMPALIAGILALGGLITSFANMYIEKARVCPSGVCLPASPSDRKADTSAQHVMSDRLEALYFSTVTIMTLGYGDLTPTSEVGRWLVIWQLMSGGTLLLLLIPLVMSRVASYATYS